MDQSLVKIGELLEAESSDEEKFAGLLLVTKALDAKDVEALRFLFNRIPFNFLTRLLSNKTTNSEIPQQLYQSIAVSITSSFCNHDEFVEHENMLSLIPQLKPILLSEDGELIKETLAIFWAFSKTKPGSHFLLLHEAVQPVTWQIEKAPENQERLLLSLSILQHLFQQEPLAMLLKQKDHIVSILPILARQFRNNQQQLKFDIMQSLIVILSNFLHQGEKANANTSWIFGTNLMWVEDLRYGIRDIISSKISSEKKIITFNLVALILAHFGSVWMFGGYARPDDQDDQNKIDNQKFAPILVNLVCIETRIYLEDGNLESISDNNANTVVTCFEIIESLLSHLTKISDKAKSKNPEKLALEPEILTQLRKALEITFGVIIEFLIGVQDKLQMAQEEKSNQTLPPFVLAMIKLLAAWFAEENEVHQEGEVTLLPLLFKACQEGQSIGANFTELLCPSFIDVTADDDGRNAFLEYNGHQIIIDHVQNLLAKMITQCSKMDLDNNGGEAEKAKEKGRDEKTRQSLLSALGVLLNIVILSQHTVKTQATRFLSLTSQLVSMGPNLVQELEAGENKNFVLIANMTVFCLFTAKLIMGDILKANSDHSSLLKMVTCFLKTSILLKHKQDDQSQELWQDVSELWFLCANAFADCLELFVNPKYSVSIQEILHIIEESKGSFQGQDQEVLSLFQQKLSKYLPK